MICRQSVENIFSTYIVSRVDMIEMIIWINIAERHRWTAIPRHIDCMRSRRSIVENFEFITMWVPIELAANDVMESINDSAVFAWPEWETAAAAAWNMFQNVNALIGSFGGQKCRMKPLKTVADMLSAVKHPPVIHITVIVVHWDDSEAGTYKMSVKSALTNCGDRLTR